MKPKQQKSIPVEQQILQANTSLGDQLRAQFDQHHLFAVNIMASPGAGKTSVILQTIKHLPQTKLAIIEGDVVEIDVDQIRQTHTPVTLANTGGDCHLDAVMVDKAIKQLNLDQTDLLLIENVGNLVCPAGFYLGTHKNVVIASVPEGDDKPYKYPNMFKGADVVILNKIDYLAYQPFDVNYFSHGIMQLNPDVTILPLSCRTGEGMSAWTDWLKTEISHHAK